MLYEVLNRLTNDQRAQLAQHGISDKRISSWRTGERLPTEVQVADLADITQSDWIELQKEVTVLRAPEARREQIAKALKWQWQTHRSPTNRRFRELSVTRIASHPQHARHGGRVH